MLRPKHTLRNFKSPTDRQPIFKQPVCGFKCLSQPDDRCEIGRELSKPTTTDPQPIRFKRLKVGKIEFSGTTDHSNLRLCASARSGRATPPINQPALLCTELHSRRRPRPACAWVPPPTSDLRPRCARESASWTLLVSASGPAAEALPWPASFSAGCLSYPVELIASSVGIWKRVGNVVNTIYSFLTFWQTATWTFPGQALIWSQTRGWGSGHPGEVDRLMLFIWKIKTLLLSNQHYCIKRKQDSSFHLATWKTNRLSGVRSFFALFCIICWQKLCYARMSSDWRFNYLHEILAISFSTILKSYVIRVRKVVKRLLIN